MGNYLEVIYHCPRSILLTFCQKNNWNLSQVICLNHMLPLAVHENLKDMLRVILYTSQFFMSITPLLYYITYRDKAILFIHNGIVGGVVAHYHVLNEIPNRKFVELNKMTGDFTFVDSVRNNSQSIYIPIARLIKSTLRFPIDESSII
jgi:hypothetical protein